MTFLSHVNKTHIHINGFALGLSWKRRPRETRKWAINLFPSRDASLGCLWCDHSSNGSLAVCLHGTSVFNILQNEIWDFLFSIFDFWHFEELIG